MHAAGFGAMLMLEGGGRVQPGNYFNIDFTGVGFTLDVEEKSAVLMDVKKDAGFDKAKKTKQQSLCLKLNMKLASAMNGEGKGMDQVYIFKHDEANAPVVVTLVDEQPGGGDLTVIFTAGSLTSAAVFDIVMEKQLLPFIAKHRKNSSSSQSQEPVVLMTDGDPENMKVLKKYESQMNELNIRAGIWGGSQTHNQQVFLVHFLFCCKQK